MAVKDNSFINKVYDSYIKDDYQYGDDNLNPKREIRKNKEEDIDNSLKVILDKISAKVDEISLKYPEADITVKNVKSNFGGSGDLGVVSPKLKLAVSRAGGDGTSLFGIEDAISPLPVESSPLIPGKYGDKDYISDIEFRIGSIIPPILKYLQNNPDTSSGGKPSSPPSLDGLDLYDINCLGTTNLISGKEQTNDDKLDTGDTTDKSTNGESSESSSDTENGSNSNNNNANNDETNTSDNAITEAVNKGYAAMQSDIAKADTDAVKCAVKDLSLLQAFLAILKIIQTLKNALQPTMNIVVELVQIVVLAAQCWNNPTCVGEIIQRITQKIIAIMIMIIVALLQMFWDMLGLDCITSQTKSVLDEIRKTLAGLSSVSSNFDSLAVSLGSNAEKVKDAFDLAKSSIEDTMKNMQNENFKQDVNSSIKKAFSSDIKSNFIKEAENQVEQTKMYDDIMKNINSVNSLKSTYKKTVSQLLKTKGKADATVAKIASQFDTVEAK